MNYTQTKEWNIIYTINCTVQKNILKGKGASRLYSQRPGIEAIRTFSVLFVALT